MLRTLEKPLELDLFFTNNMPGRGGDENDGPWIHRMIGITHRDAVESVIDRYLTHADVTGLVPRNAKMSGDIYVFLKVALMAPGENTFFYQNGSLEALDWALRRISGLNWAHAPGRTSPQKVLGRIRPGG